MASSSIKSRTLSPKARLMEIRTSSVGDARANLFSSPWSAYSAAWHVFHCYHESPKHDEEMLNPHVTKFGTVSMLDAEEHLYSIEVFAN